MKKHWPIFALVLFLLMFAATQARASQAYAPLPVVGTLTGLQAVTDMNQNSDALITALSGTTSPGALSPALGWPWLDTTAKQMKFYDGTTWISQFTYDASAHTVIYPFITIANLSALGACGDSTHALSATTTGFACQTLTGGGGASSLSALTSATTTNSIDNANFAQTWAWGTLSTQSALTFTTSSMTSGNLLTLSNTKVSSTGNVLSLSNTTTAAGKNISSVISGAANTGYAGYFTNTGTGAVNYGLYASTSSTTGYAGYFDGQAKVAGAFAVTGNLTGAAAAFTGTVTGVASNWSGAMTGTSLALSGTLTGVAGNFSGALSATGLTLTTTALPVPSGGTGLATLTSNTIYKGNGTGNIAVSALTDNGTFVISSESVDAQTNGYVSEFLNDTTTGTTTNKVAKVTSAGKAVRTATTDTDGAVGIVVGGAATSGSSQIAFSGQASCVFDGATTAGDYVTISTTAGDCHDAGSSRPTATQTLGRVLSTNGAGGTYAMALGLDFVNTAGGGSGTVNSGTAGQFAYYPSTAAAVSGNANFTISGGAVTVGVAGSQIGTLLLSGNTSGTTTLTPAAAASGTLTLPAATDTLIGKATTDTLTNKTYDTAGTGNVFKVNGTTISDKTGSGKAVLDTSPTLVTPALGTPSALVLTNATGLPTGALPANQVIRGLTFIVDGGGSTITTGVKGDLRVPFACTITRNTLLADQSGSIVVNVWKDTLANYPPTVADKITASAPPTISSATNSEDSTLTGWTTSISAGDTLRFNVDSVTTIQRVTLVLYCNAT